MRRLVFLLPRLANSALSRDQAHSTHLKARWACHAHPADQSGPMGTDPVLRVMSAASSGAETLGLRTKSTPEIQPCCHAGELPVQAQGTAARSFQAIRRAVVVRGATRGRRLSAEMLGRWRWFEARSATIAGVTS